MRRISYRHSVVALGALVSFSIALVVGCSDDDESATPDASSASDAAASSDTTTGSDGATDIDATTTDATVDVTVDANVDAPTDGGTDATSDVAVDAPVGVLGGPYALVYSGKLNGIDRRIVTAELVSGGGAAGYTWTQNPSAEAPHLVTAKLGEPSADAFYSIGRWYDGTIVGPAYDDGGVKLLFPNQGEHQAYALQGTASLPANGTASYTLLAATKPTIHTGSTLTGTITAATATVSFAGNTGTKAGVTIAFTMTDGTFNLTANGGSASVGDAGIVDNFPPDAGFFGGSLPASAQFTPTNVANNFCPSGTCPNGTLQFWFSGPNAERMLVAFVVGNGTAAGADRRAVLVLQKQ